MDNNTYTINPVGPSREPLTKQRHHRVKTGAVIAAVLALILGFTYWWIMVNKPEPVVDDSAARRRAEVLEVLNKSTYQPTPEQVKKITDQLSKSTYVPSEASKSAAIERLNNAK